MKTEETYTSTLHTHVHFVTYEPEIVLRIKAVVVVLHDTGENMEMYDHFALFLQNKGYVVVVSEIAGHGHSLIDFEQGHFGTENVLNSLITDIHRLQEMILERFPDGPFYFVGAGLGGQLVRYYGSVYSDYFSGMMLLSTACQATHLLLNERHLNVLKMMRGGLYHPSKYIRTVREKLSNKIGEHYLSWLIHNTDKQAELDEDTLSYFTYTVQGYLDLMKIYRRVNEKDVYRQTPAYLSIALLGGEEDPIIAKGKDLHKIAHNYRSVGCNDVMVKLYPNSRHAILFDDERHDVYDDIARWLDEHTYLI
ncbi:MAG: alpha/beta hydrolase [Erysipelotrichaceae bacterium]|nr:alpha/beta hydrolase [Erysipelotrichaceae bacterium]